MNMRIISFLSAVLAFATLLIGAVWYYYRSRQTPERNWETLLSRLLPVDRRSVEKIALDAIDEAGGRRQDEHAMDLEPEEVWRLIGGLKGVEALEHNSGVLIDMAFFVEGWYPEALQTAEELRLSAREIEWHVERLRSASENGKVEASIHSNAQNAVASYYMMTRNLLALYHRGNFKMLSDLQKTI
jgi:hypothetical protein